MVKPELIGENAVTMAEAKAELLRIKEKSELNFRAGKCEEYLNDFSVLNVDKANEFEKKLEGLNLSRLKRENIIHLVDLLPKTAEEVGLILSGTTLAKKDMEQIASMINEFVK